MSDAAEVNHSWQEWDVLVLLATSSTVSAKLVLQEQVITQPASFAFKSVGLIVFLQGTPVFVRLASSISLGLAKLVLPVQTTTQPSRHV